MDECDFRFFSKPYYLRLHLPGPVTESDAASGSWDADTSSFVVKCPKVNPGEHFQGLDMLTQLLMPKGDTEVRSKVEMLGGEDIVEEEGDDDDEEINWYYEQKLPQEGDPVSDSEGYGFGFKNSGVYRSLLAEYGEIVDLVNPDNLSQVQRDRARKEKELNDFSSDHYLCDLYDSVHEIEECLAYKSPFLGCIDSPLDEPLTVNSSHPSLAFTKEEQEQLLSLPTKQLMVSSSILPSVHLGLADLLYGHSYSVRVLGTDCVEAGWCCAKLSSTLSCLARFTTPRQLVVSGIRRALCYPLYRHWDLAVTVWRDVVLLLKLGRAAIMKSLLSLIPNMNSTPGHYIFNQLYVTDYTIWLQTVPESHMVALAGAIERVVEKVTKEEVELDISELEEAARLTVQEEDRCVDSLITGFGSVKVSEVQDSDDDTDDESSDDGNTSEDSNESVED